MEQNHDDQQRRTYRLLWGLVALLLIVNGVLLFQLLQSNEELDQTQEKLVSTEELKMELSAALQNAQDSIAGYQNRVEGLDSAIAEKNSELEARASRIKDLLRSQKVTKQQYKQAQRELSQLRYYIKKYQFQIDSLYRVNKRLAEQNQALKSDVRQAQRQTQELKDENARLSNKVALGARLEANQIEVTGVKVRNNGEERETRWVGNLDRLRICFRLEDNLVADKGQRIVYIKLIKPDGSPLFIESQGGGTFTYRGQDALYTFRESLDFRNEDQKHCYYWTPENTMTDGDWKVELYTDGYMMGEKPFRLRQLF